MKKLVVNADDFGLSPGVNAGIIECHTRGIVTSASLMVRQPAAEAAAAYARAHPELSVGLHLDLAEWEFRNGEWTIVYEVVPSGDADAVAGEISRQLELFRHIMGRAPTHLDSHQHAHRDEPARSIMLRESASLGAPLRSFCLAVRYCGAFYGQSDKGNPFPDGISVDALVGIVRGLPEGITELGCHPGLRDDVPSVYRNERSIECETLCDARVRVALGREGVKLVSFAEVCPD